MRFCGFRPQRRNDSRNLIDEFLKVESLSPEYYFCRPRIEEPEHFAVVETFDHLRRSNAKIGDIVTRRITPPSFEPLVEVFEVVSHINLAER